MVREGQRIDLEGFSLRVDKINKLPSVGEVQVLEIHFTIFRGTRELSNGIIYVRSDENALEKLKDTLKDNVRAVKRVESIFK